MNLPAPNQIAPDADYGMPSIGMAPGLALMFNDKLYDRVKQIALVMAQAEGMFGPHLVGKHAACVAVVTRSITWRLDPFAVAACTYQTPGGRVGYEGKLIQAILENSGKLEGPVTYEHFGDWDKLKGKFEIKKGTSGKDYPAPTWKREDVGGIGVIVRAKVKGEAEPRMLSVNLDEMFPLNSTLWATRPKQQICYTACRAFANICAPGLVMGVPWDTDDSLGTMVDITPRRPQASDFDTPKVAEQPATETAVSDVPSAVEEVSKPAETSTETHDPETGEVAEENEPSAADAFEMGRADRDRNKASSATPLEFRERGMEKFRDAWRDGWKARDEEIAQAKAKK
jgi:hypothetical protein